MTDDPSAAAPVPPPVPPAVPPQPAPHSRRREKQGRNWRVRWIWLAALAVFAAFVIAMSGSKSEFVTYAEALEIASIVERAQTPADVRPLLDMRVPAVGAAPGDPVEIDWSDAGAHGIAGMRAKATLTFVCVGFDERAGRTLLFRVHRGVSLIDYFILRLERRAEAVRVTGFYSLMFGGWIDQVRGQLNGTPHAELAMSASDQLFGNDVTEVPAELRRTLPFAVKHLHWLVRHDAQAFPAALEQFHRDFPRNAAADLIVVNSWEILGMKPEEAIAAIGRIEEQHNDPDFSAQLREKVWQ